MSKILSCCLSFDFDAMSVWIGTGKSNNPCAISRGEFAAVAMPRILALLKKYGIRASFCIPGHTAYAYPDWVKTIRDQGHEIVHHGWVHENTAEFDRQDEKDQLEKGLQALHTVAGVTPIGYRSPGWSLNPDSHALLSEYNFSYDSSGMGGDFYPYYLRLGDRWPADDRYHFGQYCELLEVPVHWVLDDFPHFEAQYNPPSTVLEIWRAEFDYALANAPGGLFSLTLHPQVIGRGHRITMLETLIQHMSSQAVRFEPYCDYVQRWKSSNPLALWEQSSAVSHSRTIPPAAAQEQ